MVKTMNMLMVLQDISYKEILDLRCAYEYTALRLAVENITPEELTKIRSILERMDREINPKDSAALDVQFHNMLLFASRNRLLQMYTQTMSSLLDQFIHDFRTRILMDEDKAAELRTAHWDIYNALANRDYNAGVIAMDQHFKIVNEAAVMDKNS
jgi:GntR family transcriptional repressor for pyruvate dehydrogenase complex